MQGEMKERWVDLCAQAAIVEDHDGLIELVREIDRLLGEKESRLRQQRNSKFQGAA